MIVRICLAFVVSVTLFAAPAWSQDISPEEATRQLLDQGYSEVNVQGMAWTLNPPQPELLRLFLAAGVSVDDQIELSGEGPEASSTPLQYVLGFSCEADKTAEVIEVLLAAGADPDGWLPNGYTPLSAAYNCPTVLSHLVAAGADVQQRDTHGHSPLYNAIVFGSVESVQVLVDAGFVPGEEFGELADMARQDLDKKALLELANTRAIPTASNDLTAGIPGARSLEQALYRREVEVAQQFLASEGGSKIDDESPLLFLMSKCNPEEDAGPVVELVQALLAEGVAVDEPDPLLNETPLYRAAWQCPVEVVQALLDAGANPNAKAGNDQTPLFQAVFGGKPAIVEALVAAGAKADKNTKFFAKGKPEIRDLLKKAR